MTFRESIKMIRTDPWNAWYFWQGTIRQWLFNNYPMFIRAHIQEQYFFRLGSSVCSELASCKICGCSIPGGLFFADKACALSKVQPVNFSILGVNRVCYPKMMDRHSWELYKKHHKL